MSSGHLEADMQSIYGKSEEHQEQDTSLQDTIATENVQFSSDQRGSLKMHSRYALLKMSIKTSQIPEFLRVTYIECSGSYLMQQQALENMQQTVSRIRKVHLGTNTI